MDSVLEQSAGPLPLTGSHTGYVTKERPQRSLIVGCPSSLSTIERMPDYTVSRLQIPEGAEAAVCYKGKYERNGGNLNFAEVNALQVLNCSLAPWLVMTSS